MKRKDWHFFGIIWICLAVFQSSLDFLGSPRPQRFSFLQSTLPRLADFGLIAILAPLLLLITERLQRRKVRWWGLAVFFIGGYPLFCVVHAFLWNIVDRGLWLLFGERFSYISMLVANGGFKSVGFFSCLADLIVMNLRGMFMHYFLAVALIYALIFHQQNYEKGLRTSRLEAGLARAKLQALTAHLQPHFLFNTLNAISCLVHVNPDTADEMIGRLARLLRRTLEKRDTPMTPFKGEIDFLQEYLGIEQVRFGDRLTLTWEIGPAAADVPFLFMTLQPLVENAIRHGVAPIPGEGRIRIAARVKKQYLEVDIEDNGPGLAEGWVEGFGLQTTRSRLAKLYETDFLLSIENVRGNTGVRVHLRVPVTPPAYFLPTKSRTDESLGVLPPCAS